MEIFKVIMVEDDDAEAAVLTHHLERYGAEQDVRFSVHRYASATDFVGDHAAADLVFMDIDLPGIDGMEAARHLRDHDTTVPLIFVTNLAQYAVRGYQVDALDFMVKPVGYEDFAMRMGRALRAMRRNARTSITIAAVSGTFVLRQDDIVYVELVRHDLVYHLAGQSDCPRVRGSLSAIEAELPADTFVRVSQGCLANMAHVSQALPDSFVMDNDTHLYFSRARKRPCLETFSRFLGGTL